MKTTEIRKVFKDYFVSKGHFSVESSNLAPNDDKTLLFTNAGMVQFKDVFLGVDSRSYSKATSSQKCLRAGGKHNDLDNVGYTARHHTFFEMLGNFSFGDYFKKEAITYAWDFLTNVLSLSKERLWISVYSEDEETRKIWVEDIGVDSSRISLISTSDNFWSMGDTGPCGPCTEIFYDHGDEILGGPPGSSDEDGDRYVEIWNIVFMQYNRQLNGSLEKLPNPSVDTGMGLERIAAIMQGVTNNYDIDIFKTLISDAAKILSVNDLSIPSLRVISDHIRSCAFLIAEGVFPSNEGRGYVLRRIIRRAVRHGFQLSHKKESFFYLLVPSLVKLMGEEYPELVLKSSKIADVLYQEEKQFAKTIETGIRLFEQSIRGITGDEISGDIAFKLYDTYGFPLDLTEDLARERNLVVNTEEFAICMEQQRERAKTASTFNVDYNDVSSTDINSDFLGYSLSQTEGKVAEIFNLSGCKLESLHSGNEGVIILDKTAFYAESGGQVGDIGFLESFGSKFIVKDTRRVQGAILHTGIVASGGFSLDDEVTSIIDVKRRAEISHNHSATHLLHASLKRVIGKTAEQKGSYVDNLRLRFDYSSDAVMTHAQLKEVEALVNSQIRRNLIIETVVATKEEAKSMGALALFGEKYGELVRVLRIGDFSVELCGGTHAAQTGDIGYFKILSDVGVASGVRRIEAVTGATSERVLNDSEDLLNSLMGVLRTNNKSALKKLNKVLELYKSQEKELLELKLKLSNATVSNSSDIDIKKIGGVLVYANIMKDANMNILRDSIDRLKLKHDNIIVLLATESKGRAQIAAGVSKKISADYKANELVSYVAKQVDGKGGGRADMAQAGGTNIAQLENAVNSTYCWVEEKFA
jgi:alanyl-tRNA synthetase